MEVNQAQEVELRRRRVLRRSRLKATPAAMPAPLDFDDAVFPPSRHEGLAVHRDPPLLPTPPPPPPPIDGVSSLPMVSWARFKIELWRRLRLAFEILRSKFLPLPLLDGARLVGYWGVMWWCFAGSTVVSVAAVLWVIRRRRRRRPVTNESDSLLLLVQDKDRKISQLLHQVAEMNEKISQLVHQIAEANELHLGLKLSGLNKNFLACTIASIDMHRAKDLQILALREPLPPC